MYHTLELRRDMVMYLSILLLQPQGLFMNLLIIIVATLRVYWPEILAELDHSIDADEAVKKRKKERVPMYSEEVFNIPQPDPIIAEGIFDDVAAKTTKKDA